MTFRIRSSLSAATMEGDAHDRITPTMDLGGLAPGTAGYPEEPATVTRPSLQPFQVPFLMVTLDQLRELPIDPRAAFLVSLIDGQCSVETIGDMAGLSRGDVAEVFTLLVRLGAVELRDPAR